MTVLVVDTGVLLAAADTADPDHEASVEVLTTADGPLVTTWLVIAEVGYLIDRQLGSAAEARFYRSVAAGDFGVQTPTEDDLARMAELIEQYADLDLGGTDASLIVLAERLGQRTIATLDRRHFAVVRPEHTSAFDLIP